MSPAFAVILIVAFAVTSWACGCAFWARSLSRVMRVAAGMVLAAVALFCVYGFVAAMEPGEGHIVWRVGYTFVFLTCLLAIVWLGLAQRVGDKAIQV